MADEHDQDHAAEQTGVDKLLASVEAETSVRGGVAKLVGGLANEFEMAAMDGTEASEKFAKELKAKSQALADAVEANVPAPSSDAPPLKAPSGPAPTAEELDAMAHAAPHNDAAAAAVAVGMDTKTANLMTAQGSNS